MSDLFDEARRYVNMARAGWRDPEVDALDLIEALCDERDHVRDQTYTIEEHDSAIEDAVKGATERLLDPEDPEERAEFIESLSVKEHMEALQVAIDRERRESYEEGQGGCRAVIANRDSEVSRLKLQLGRAADEARTYREYYLEATESKSPRKSRKPPKLKTLPEILPENSGKLTKKTRQVMQEFVGYVSSMLIERGAVLISESLVTEDDIIGHDVRRYELQTRAGRWVVTPYGNMIVTCFDDPERARPYCNGGQLNEYSGKANCHYHGASMEAALDGFRNWLDLLVPPSSEVA